jgi:hypothetical protein
VAWLVRVVRPTVERPAVGRQEDRHRPAAATGHGLDGAHVDLVEVGPLLAIDLDRDEPVVQQPRRRLVLERLAFHHVTPVTGRVADAQEDRPIEQLRPGERVGTPGEPVDRVVGVLEEVGTRLAREAVGHRLMVQIGAPRQQREPNKARMTPYKYGAPNSTEVPFCPHVEGGFIVRRFGAALIAALLVVGVCAPAAFAAAPKAKAAVPKVVFIVGPAGAATDRYRAQARAAAAIARHYTPDVTELYSPQATWPAVRDATQGASLVVYMGHGNGWPSQYRDALYPVTQNGFGLNPAPGGDDATHQYFGEASVGSEIKLAKNAIVLLNHLCYASGNSEPGLAEGTLADARQRVDNYAAGFIRAGAAAVIAEAWASPSYFVRTILAGTGSIQAAWQRSPSANGHRFAFASERSRGYVAQMDPETASAGFTRSIVMKSGLAPRDVLAGAAGSAPLATAALLPVVPTLASAGMTVSAPTFAALPGAATKTNLHVAYTIKDRKALPKGIQASVRWDPIDVAIAPVDPATEVTGGDTAPAADPAAPATAPAGSSAPAASTAAPATSAEPAAGAEVTPADSSAAAADPSAAASNPGTSSKPATSGTSEPKKAGKPAEAADPDSNGAASTPTSDATVTAPRGKEWIDAPTDEVDLVVPEQAGDVVAPVAAKVTKKDLLVPVTLPTAPGRYRLTVTLHDADGVAYDAATQAMLPAQIVRVTGPFDGAIVVAPTATLRAGGDAGLGVRVLNLGRKAWGHAAIKTPSDAVHEVPAAPAAVVARWVPLTPGIALPAGAAAQGASTNLPVGLAPGKSADAWLDLVTPDVAGEYLLVLDIVSPDDGSLIASGANPTLVRVTVTAAD